MNKLFVVVVLYFLLSLCNALALSAGDQVLYRYYGIYTTQTVKEVHPLGIMLAPQGDQPARIVHSDAVVPLVESMDEYKVGMALLNLQNHRIETIVSIAKNGLVKTTDDDWGDPKEKEICLRNAYNFTEGEEVFHNSLIKQIICITREGNALLSYKGQCGVIQVSTIRPFLDESNFNNNSSAYLNEELRPNQQMGGLLKKKERWWITSLCDRISHTFYGLYKVLSKKSKTESYPYDSF